MLLQSQAIKLRRVYEKRTDNGALYYNGNVWRTRVTNGDESDDQQGFWTGGSGCQFPGRAQWGQHYDPKAGNAPWKMVFLFSEPKDTSLEDTSLDAASLDAASLDAGLEMTLPSLERHFASEASP